MTGARVMENGHEVLTEGPSAGTAGFRLSPQQEQLWRNEPDGPRLSASCVIDAGGPDPAAVREAVGRLVARHEILRTTFVRRPGMKLPSQVINDRLDPAWDEGAAAIDPVRGPVVHAQLIEEGARRLLKISVSAACADARSLALLARELRAELAGDASRAEPLQYADYAEWRSEALAGGGPAASGEALPASPTLPFASGAEYEGPPRSITVPLEPAALSRGASACRVPEPVFLEACWHACLARVSGADAVLVGTVIDGRTHEELGAAIGPYAQALPLASAVEETTSVAELVDRVRRAHARLVEDQDAVDGAVLAETVRRCRLGFSTMAVPHDSDVSSVFAAPAPFLAELVVIENGAAPQAEIHVAPALAESGTGVLLARTLAAIVAGAADDTDASVLDLPVAAPDVAEPAVFDGAPSLARDETVAELFERAAAESPTAKAVVAFDGALTYEELNGRANRLAHRLRALGVGRDEAVALCMERSTSSIVALLAAVKAGGAYLPLNFEHPPARLSHQLSESGARVLVAEASVSDRIPPFDGPVLILDREEALDEEPSGNPEAVSKPDDLVYVMYTSGSTGMPKGAGVTHRNLVNYTSGILERLGFAGAGGVRFAAMSALSTDLGNTSIFPALLGGGTLHLVSPDDAVDGERFAAYLRSHPLDVLKLTPSHLRALIDAVEPTAVMPREWLVLGGEALAWQLVDRLRKAAPRCRILNHYGPTETTVGTCVFEVGSAAPHGATVPVGSPLPGTRAYVVDRRLQPLPLGVPGELCIGGTGVARGYVRRPDETAASFIPDPFTDEDGARLYRTGDRVRALRDGSIEFLGRVDDQVKIRGYRVEPGEVERVLATHSAVRQSAVVSRSDGDGGHELFAYVVRSDDATTDELQSFLRESVPAYMVPARFVWMDALPLTPSGKIDRRSLPDPGEVERGVEYVAPRTPVEEELARIWQELLGVDRVGVHDDFFALGGHSLLATQAVIRIRNAVADVPLHSLFKAPTVAALAEAIVDAELMAAANTVG
jgi:amino acid adenylation domain-containing protein